MKGNILQLFLKGGLFFAGLLVSRFQLVDNSEKMNNSSCDGGCGRRVPLGVGAFIETGHAINSVKSDS